MSELAKKILTSIDRKRLPVVCDEWGVTVYVSEMTLADKRIFTQIAQDGSKDEDIGRVIAQITEDESGDKIFTPEDSEGLNGKNHKVLQRILDTYRELNGLNNNIEDVEKN